MFSKTSETIVNLSLADGNGTTENIHTTLEHPFWVVGKGWIYAGNLSESDNIETIKGISEVESISYSHSPEKVYNFEVEDYHTYYVGDDGYLVHNDCKPSKPYKRPSGATTKAQRQSVQGKPCVDCGKTTAKQFADHKKPLVKEFYETGTIDKIEMRSLDAVQPQCRTCSSRQGAEMSRYSRSKKLELGL